MLTELLVTLLFVASPSHYYGLDLDSLEEEEVKTHLHKVVNWKHMEREDTFDLIVEKCPEALSETTKCYGPRVLSYREAREQLFGYLHLSADARSIRDVYALRTFTQEDFGDQDGPGRFRIPFHEILNTEHTWPQSRFSREADRGMQKSDLHHLFPTANRLNSYRGNYPFGETDGEIGNYQTSMGQFESFCRRGTPTIPTEIDSIQERPTVVFQAPEEHRGNIARALFYFSVRYEMPIDAVEEYYLRKWNRDDPVDCFEIERNEKIFEIQLNRNPFIDFPHLATRIADF